MTTRRKLLVALGTSVLAVPLASFAQQQAAKVPRIGVILTGDVQYTRDAFLQGLRERGWMEGRNILIEYRPVGDKLERVPDIAAELVGLNVDVIVASANQVIIALKRITQTIPIVMSVVGDPVGAGFITSLARPGGNITGLSNVAEGLSAKRLEILKEIDPRISRVAVLRNSIIPTHGVLLKETEIAAKALKLTLVPVDFRDANDFEDAFKTMARERANALIVFPDPVTAARGTLIASLAARHGLAAMYARGEPIEAGGLVAYGPNNTDLWRRSASYVDRILKGARPADLPVELPIKFELVINIKTARALGITIPQSILVRVDRVIE